MRPTFSLFVSRLSGKQWVMSGLLYRNPCIWFTILQSVYLEIMSLSSVISFTYFHQRMLQVCQCFHNTSPQPFFFFFLLIMSPLTLRCMLCERLSLFPSDLYIYMSRWTLRNECCIQTATEGKLFKWCMNYNSSLHTTYAKHACDLFSI